MQLCNVVRCCAEGVKAEAAYAKNPKDLPDPNSTTNAEFKVCAPSFPCLSFEAGRLVGFGMSSAINNPGCTRMPR